jgi:F0F1-type ATP synthase assembly protein I
MRPSTSRERKEGRKSNGMDLGLRVLSYLISGVLVYGLLGWLGDHYLGTRFLLPIGIVAGAAFGVYVIIRRFGRIDDEVSAAGTKDRSNQATLTEHRHEAERGER